MKFGGTSVGSVDRINHVSSIVKSEFDLGNQVVVVLSAMAGETDKLINLTKDLSDNFLASEYDVVISSGEQVSAGALSGLLNSQGVKAQSRLGWQIPIVTSGDHKSSRIEAIHSKELINLLESNVVVIIPGFQGINSEGRITTLGRGGSDTSAVAIAAAIDADFCDIYTDVDGVYTSDPNKVPTAKRLDKISYEEMLEMASLGAKVLQTRSVETAMNNDVVLRVLSSFSDLGEDKKGTLVCSEDSIADKKIVTGVAASTNDAKLTLTGIKDKPGVAADILGELADNGINVDMIVQNISGDRKTTDLTFTVPKDEFTKAKSLMENLSSNLSYKDLIVDSNIAKISIVGVGMRSNAGVASQMFRILSQNNINIDVISTSEIKISVLINKELTEKALNTLHDHFELGKAS
jgi:aspartate kinase|tara:strand:- start:152 stop:1372 length:1221 start_codon:yes stop_codon:yes gene_type:complete